MPNAGELRYAVLHADTVDEAIGRVRAFFAEHGSKQALAS
jgi:Tfp pilus assembly ATPase PilU